MFFDGQLKTQKRRERLRLVSRSILLKSGRGFSKKNKIRNKLNEK